MDQDYCIELLNIEKSFSVIPVLRGVNLTLRTGEIHALLGENGAGKSTLMNILGGIVQKSCGAIKYFGEEIEISSPAQARGLGIGFIHQELNLIPTLTVFENIFIGEEYKKGILFLDDKKMIAETNDILNSLGVHINPIAIVSDLTPSYRQIIEIARAIRLNSKIIIMDEPTASLTDKEIERLFVIMRALKAKGVGIIFISHKLKEVLNVCDKYTVLRDGIVAGEGFVSEVDEEKIVGMMVGRSLYNENYYNAKEIGNLALEVTNLCLKPHYEKINFAINKGEIVGFTGLLGDGRSEVFETIFGYRQATQGSIIINGSKVKIDSTIAALKYKIGYVPKNRKDNSIIWNLSIRENLTIASLGSFVRRLFVNQKKERLTVEKYTKEININLSDIENPITSLSGGNQQKVILSRWLSAQSNILILDNPTQGIDVGAKSEIYHYLVKLAENGMTIIVLSSEIEEIQKICDRVYVMYHGALVGEMGREKINEENIMLYATGVRNDYE